MLKITQGDATYPVGEDYKIIVHCVNDIKTWGSGFVLAINKRWLEPRKFYLENNGKLGDIQVCLVEPDIAVCNLYGQQGVGGETIGDTFVPPVRYEALRIGLLRLKNWINQASKSLNISVHAPLICAGLAGGSLDKVYDTVKEVFGDSKTDFTFYAWSEQDWRDLQATHKLLNLAGPQKSA